MLSTIYLTPPLLLLMLQTLKIMFYPTLYISGFHTKPSESRWVAGFWVKGSNWVPRLPRLPLLFDAGGEVPSRRNRSRWFRRHRSLSLARRRPVKAGGTEAKPGGKMMKTMENRWNVWKTPIKKPKEFVEVRRFVSSTSFRFWCFYENQRFVGMYTRIFAVDLES